MSATQVQTGPRPRDLEPPRPARRSISELLAPLERLSTNSSSLVANRGANFDSGSETCELSRCTFIGQQNGGAPLRIGIFAGINGDEPDGAYALVEFVRLLEAKPALAAGYCLSLYPVCNPTGFEDNTRCSRLGADLNRLFWSGSDEPEILLLQAELRSHAFDGIITLHSDPRATSFYGAVRGPALTRHLLVSVLTAAGIRLPVAQPAADAPRLRDHEEPSAYCHHPGSLSAPPEQQPQPFEVNLVAPKAPATCIKQLVLVAAMRAILAEYRKFSSHAPYLTPRIIV